MSETGEVTEKDIFLQSIELTSGISLKDIQEVQGAIQRLTSLPVYVAGGCLRDILLGRKAKDIDLFIEHQPAECKEIKSLLTSAFNTSDMKRYIENEDIIDGIKLMGLVRPDIDVLFTKLPPRDHVTLKFDMDICKVYWHPDEGLYRTRQFEEAVRNKCIRVDRQLTNNGHIERVTTKYGKEYTFEIFNHPKKSFFSTRY